MGLQTRPYVILERLSDLNYKIQHVTNATKVSIVHFDRLKRCTPSTRFQQATTPVQPHPPVVDVGDNAELLDNDDVDTVPQEASPRYPHRNRHKPDRLNL